MIIFCIESSHGATVDPQGLILDLNATCPTCGYRIKPGETRVINDKRVACPKWGHEFSMESPDVVP
jgi:DNA-directed RNA polymerase subunit RPC12/RpoP